MRRMLSFLFEGIEPCHCHHAAAGAHGRSIDQDRRRFPNCRCARLLAASTARRPGARRRCPALLSRCDCETRRWGLRRWLRPEVGQHSQTRVSIRDLAKLHLPAAVNVVARRLMLSVGVWRIWIPWRGRPARPDPDQRPAPGRETRKPCCVCVPSVMGAGGSRPGRSAVLRPRDFQVVGLRIGTVFLNPCGGETSIRKGQHRGHVRGVDHQVGARDDRARRGTSRLAFVPPSSVWLA